MMARTIEVTSDKFNTDRNGKRKLSLCLGN
jgi:hypothetical protein